MSWLKKGSLRLVNMFLHKYRRIVVSWRTVLLDYLSYIIVGYRHSLQVIKVYSSGSLNVFVLVKTQSETSRISVILTDKPSGSMVKTSFNKILQHIVTTGGSDSLLITQRKNERANGKGWHRLEKWDSLLFYRELWICCNTADSFLAGQLVNVSVEENADGWYLTFEERGSQEGESERMRGDCVQRVMIQQETLYSSPFLYALKVLLRWSCV